MHDPAIQAAPVVSPDPVKAIGIVAQTYLVSILESVNTNDWVLVFVKSALVTVTKADPVLAAAAVVTF